MLSNADSMKKLRKTRHKMYTATKGAITSGSGNENDMSEVRSVNECRLLAATWPLRRGKVNGGFPSQSSDKRNAGSEIPCFIQL